MSLESTNTIAGLVAANPTAGDPFSEGDDHLRLVKTVLKNIFPGSGGQGFSIPLTASEVELNYVDGVTSAIQTQLDAVVARIPYGVICMWHGSIVGVPAGWRLCDGTGGTPDLTGKFVLCYDVTLYPVIGAIGGTADAAVIAHVHTATSTPNIAGLSTSTVAHTHTTDSTSTEHTHAYTTVTGPGALSGSGTGLATAQTGGMSANAIHSHTIPSGGAHLHDITGTMTVATTIATATGGVAGTGKNLPPYMVLAYIMKI